MSIFKWCDEVLCATAVAIKLTELHDAVFLTTAGRGGEFRSRLEFAIVCRNIRDRLSSLKDCTPSQRDFVQRGLLAKRSLFRCCLPEQSLSLVELKINSIDRLREWKGKPHDIPMRHGLKMAARQLVGLSRAEVEVGDIIAVIIGCNVPIILRPVKETRHFRVVGAAYVERLMKGEALGKLPEVEITLC